MAFETPATTNGTRSAASREAPPKNTEGVPFAAAKLRTTDAIAFRTTSTGWDGSTKR